MTWQFNPSKVHTHSSEHTHTPWTHTRSSGQPFMLRRPGSSWGFGALLKGTSVVVLSVERALYIHSPHLQFLPARDSNLQPLDYESDSLTIRPRLHTSHDGGCVLYRHHNCYPFPRKPVFYISFIALVLSKLTVTINFCNYRSSREHLCYIPFLCGPQNQVIPVERTFDFSVYRVRSGVVDSTVVV